jgi:hypothetical protein
MFLHHRPGRIGYILTFDRGWSRTSLVTHFSTSAVTILKFDSRFNFDLIFVKNHDFRFDLDFYTMLVHPV